MKKKYSLILTLALCCLLSFNHTIRAQATFTEVYNIIQNNSCANAGCHSGATPSAGLDFGGTAAQVYDNLVNVVPQNPTAAAKGHSLIEPGYPYRSYLLRKINNGLLDEHDAPNEPAEGALMPGIGGAPALSNVDVEIVRQWILAGAPETGNVVDIGTLTEYYTEGGLPPVVRPEPPAAGEGFQIHLGPIFLDPFAENEWSVKYEIESDDPIEVNRINTKMTEFSHHFILYKFNGTAANSVDEGLREVGFANNPFTENNELVSVWQFDDDIQLPPGTAYFWEDNAVLDLNFHVANYSGTGILPADAYINVYTQPQGTALKEMKSELLLYEGFLGGFFFLPSGESTLSEPINFSEDWNIWLLNSHTHQYATDFDVFLQDAAGNKGEQIFEGHYDYTTCDCEVGFYDWSHPPVRYFEPFLTVPAGSGLWHEAKYDNTSGGLVTFGLTTNDEMMITIVQYTEGDPLPFVSINGLQNSYCITNEPTDFLELEPAGGILEGPGAIDGQFVPSVAGIGTHELTYTFEGISVTQEVTVYANPDQPEITDINNQLSTPQVADYTYQWYIDGVIIEGAISPVYMATTSGNYTVEAINSDGCGTISEPLFFNISGIDSPTDLAGFSISPNPFHHTTTIRYTLAQTANVKLEVINLMGQSQPLLNNVLHAPGEHQYSLSSIDNALPNGIYFVHLTIDNQTFVQKMVVQE